MFALNVFGVPDDKPPPQDEWCDEQGALAIAERIKAYWAKRGFHVETRVIYQPFSHGMRSGRYDVRSDLMNALPRRPLPPQSEAA